MISREKLVAVVSVVLTGKWAQLLGASAVC